MHAVRSQFALIAPRSEGGRHPASKCVTHRHARLCPRDSVPPLERREETRSTTTSPRPNAGVGYYASITIGADGFGLISYLDNNGFDLKIAHCSNAACTTATFATLDSAGAAGWHSSVTIGADGLGLISYYDYTNTDLKVAHCANVTCTPFYRSSR